MLNPALLVEVLSPSTEAYDRGAKFELYRRIPSLREVVFAAQDRRAVEAYRRGGDGRWTLYEPDPATGGVELASVGVVLSLDGVYAKVGLDPHPPLHPRSGEGATG